MKCTALTICFLFCTHAWAAWEKDVPVGRAPLYFTDWGPLNALLTDEKIRICLSTLANMKADDIISQCSGRVQNIATLHAPLRGLLAEQVRGVCERLTVYLAALSSSAASNQKSASDVCATLSGDTAGVKKEGQEPTCEAVRRLLFKGVALESVCSRLSLAESCLDDLKKANLRGTATCNLGPAVVDKNAARSGTKPLLSAQVAVRPLASDRFEHACLDTVGKLRSSKLAHSLREQVDRSELLFWNVADEAVLRDCTAALVRADTEAAMARHVCWDLAASFVISQRQEVTSGDQLSAFCHQYYDWFTTSSFHVSEVVQAPIRLSSRQLRPPPLVRRSPTPATQLPSLTKNATITNIGTDAPDDDTVTSVEDAEAKAKAAKDKADRIAQHEHAAKVDAETISAKAAAVKLDAEAMKKTEAAAKKEAEAIAKKASDAKADAESLARKARDAQIDAQKIAEKALEANTDVQVIEKNAKDVSHDAKELLSKAEIVSIAARRMAHSAAEAAQNVTKWEKKVTDLKTIRVKDEHIPMSSWT